ncbi:MAG: hypothetical protein NTZ07_03095 [Candidatus Woesebacteria bacterium]|nr:hypothetical protein [Candidatus Woesebacteria bacterium]
MSNTAKQAGQTARDLAQKIARQMVEEPLEVVKNAGSQVAGSEQVANRQEVRPLENQNPEGQAKMIQHQNELLDKAKSGRRMEALNQEIKDIHKQDLFKDLQNKIAQGMEVPVADYTELSMEQKQVLKAQMEAVRAQAAKQQTAGQKILEIPRSKRGRRFGQTQKQEAERQQTRVEKPVPPSG